MKAGSCSLPSDALSRCSGAFSGTVVTSGKFSEGLHEKNIYRAKITKGLESPEMKVWIIQPRKEQHPAEMLTEDKANREGVSQEGELK